MNPLINEEGAVDLFNIIEGISHAMHQAVTRIEKAAGRGLHGLSDHMHLRHHARG